MGGSAKSCKEKKMVMVAAPSSSALSGSTRLLLCITPLIVVFVLVPVLGPKSLNWDFKFQSPWVVRGSAGGKLNSGKAVDEVVSPAPSTVEIGQVNDQILHDAKEGESMEEALTNISTIAPSPNIAPSPYKDPADNATSFTNETDIVRKEYTKLDRLEAGLQMARMSIRAARLGKGNQDADPDYVPASPMYWNAKAFHRSYLEMEKQFKIYVYPEGEPPLFHNGPCKSIYSMEGNFIHGLELDGHYRTNDPEKAHVFFLPFSVTMLVRFVYDSNSHNFGPIKQTVLDYINVIAENYPYWNRSLAADHFMLACHDWGPETSRSVPELYKNAIRVLCNANTSEGFIPSKDVSFPEVNLVTGNAEGFIGGPSPSKRDILAFFAGGLHGPIRPILIQRWQNKDQDMQVHQYLRKGVSYYSMMKRSRFCLCPSGYEVASPRVVEALYAGCVPVLLSSGYVPPFSDVMNWKAFAVIVPVEDIPNLKDILTRISSRNYIRMQRRGVQVRRHFVVNFPPKRYDVYHMILHSIWLRRLNVRIKDAQQVQ